MPQQLMDSKELTWRRKWQPIQYSCLGNPMNRGSELQSIGVAKESDMAQPLNKELIGTKLFENDQVMGRLWLLFFFPRHMRKTWGHWWKGTESQDFCPWVSEIRSCFKVRVMPLGLLWGELAQWFVEKEPAIAISVFMSSSNTGYIHPLGKIRLLNPGLIFLQKPSKTNHLVTKGHRFLQTQQSAKLSCHAFTHLFNKHLLNTYLLQRLKKKKNEANDHVKSR